MIEQTLAELKIITEKLYNSILADIEDVKQAKHESLVERNDLKLELMDKLASLKQQLNSELAEEHHSGKDISIYRESVDDLEVDLRKLYQVNGKLASIVLPVKEMYREIIEEITTLNGGSLVEVRA